MSTEKAKLAAKVSYHRRVAAHPLFPRWTSILQRTGHRKGAKPSDVAVYAKRGIDICAEWLSFDAFEKWALANGYKPGLVIDRIDNDRGYSPDNCRFVTHERSQRNRRVCHMVKYRGFMIRLRDAYDMSGCKLGYKNVLNRFRKGWDVERALSEPL